MPLYDYRCRACGSPDLERLLSLFAVDFDITRRPCHTTVCTGPYTAVRVGYADRGFSLTPAPASA
jgi:hypothetical protein